MTSFVPPGRPRWKKSSFSGESNCVELASAPNQGVAMRNSKHPLDAVVVFDREAFNSFLQGVKDGQFDDLV